MLKDAFDLGYANKVELVAGSALVSVVTSDGASKAHRETTRIGARETSWAFRLNVRANGIAVATDVSLGNGKMLFLLSEDKTVNDIVKIRTAVSARAVRTSHWGLGATKGLATIF
jgi:hypothetical protein